MLIECRLICVSPPKGRLCTLAFVLSSFSPLLSETFHTESFSHRPTLQYMNIGQRCFTSVYCSCCQVGCRHSVCSKHCGDTNRLYIQFLYWFRSLAGKLLLTIESEENSCITKGHRSGLLVCRQNPNTHHSFTLCCSSVCHTASRCRKMCWHKIYIN